MGSYLWSCLPHLFHQSSGEERTEAWPDSPCLLVTPQNQDPLRTAASGFVLNQVSGSLTDQENKDAQSQSGVCALALWQAQPGWLARLRARTRCFGQVQWCWAEAINESKGLVSKRTNASPLFKHPNVTEKLGLHFQKESVNLRLQVSLTMSWLKSRYSSWNTSKHNQLEGETRIPLKSLDHFWCLFPLCCSD